MKRIVEESTGDGLEKLLGETVQLWCMNYIYSGKLIGVNDEDVCLANAVIVYETGTMTEAGWKDAQPVGVGEFFIRTSAVEAYGLVR
jgi:hypothetical protein